MCVLACVHGFVLLHGCARRQLDPLMHIHVQMRLRVCVCVGGHTCSYGSLAWPTASGRQNQDRR